MKNYILSFILIITSMPLQIIIHRILIVNFEWLNTVGYGLCLYLSQIIFLSTQLACAVILATKELEKSL